MTRLALGIALVLALSACSVPGGDDDGKGPLDTGRDAEEFRTKMDAFARELLPDLREALGGRFSGMEAHFYEKSGNWGLWNYTAGGQVQKPEGTRQEVLEAAADVLREHGMDVEQDDSGAHGTKANIGVSVEPALDADVAKVGLLSLEISSIEPLTSDGDYAEQARPESYLAYLG